MREILCSWICMSMCVALYAQSPNNKFTNYNVSGQQETNKLLRIQQQLDSVGPPTLPSDGKLVRHAAYISGYSTKHKQPYWVEHILTRDILYSNFSPAGSFHVDSVLGKWSANDKDYENSGYDRGHMAPCADFRWSKKAINESFYYSNVSPQLPAFNRGCWAKLETLIRQWVTIENELYIVTGPLLNQLFTNIQQGSYQVSLPHYFYKIVVDLYPPDYKAIGFLLPEKASPFLLSKYVVSIDSLEHLSGIDFFAGLDDSLECLLEKQANIRDWEKDYKDETDSVALKNFGNQKLNTSQAKDFIGKNVTVCGKVVSAKYIENGKTNPTYINLDKKFPDQQFTIVIYGDSRQKFSYVPEEFLMNKTICVQGKVGQYKDIPQIIVTNESQIEIVE